MRDKSINSDGDDSDHAAKLRSAANMSSLFVRLQDKNRNDVLEKQKHVDIFIDQSVNGEQYPRESMESHSDIDYHHRMSKAMEDSSSEMSDSLVDVYERHLQSYQDLNYKVRKANKRKRRILQFATFLVIIGVSTISVLAVVGNTNKADDEKEEFELSTSIFSDNDNISSKDNSAAQKIKKHRCNEIRTQNINYFFQENICSNKHIPDPVKTLKCQMILTSYMFCDWKTANIDHDVNKELEIIDMFQYNVSELKGENEDEMIVEICSVESIMSNEGFGACEKICSSRACCFMKGKFECRTFATDWCDVFKDCENLFYVQPHNMFTKDYVFGGL